MDIGYFLKLMTEKNASDMFLTTGAPVNIKVEGKLYPLGNTGLPSGMVKKIAYSLMDEGQVPAFERDLELNLAIAVKDAGRFRINVFKQRGEIGMVIRAIKSEIPSFAQLKLPPEEAQRIAAEADKAGDEGIPWPVIIFMLFIFLFFVLPILTSIFGGGGKRLRGGRSGPIVWSPGGFSGGSSGGFSSGGFSGGFSGGGGSFGGGGSSGSW